MKDIKLRAYYETLGLSKPFKLGGYPTWGNETLPYWAEKCTFEHCIVAKDKNNKELYEGDIIKHNGTLFKVKYSETLLGFVCVDWKHKTRGGQFNWRSGDWMIRVRSISSL